LKHFIMHLVVVYGYPGIFGALVIGIFGAPIPDEILLSFAGYLSSKGEMKLHLAIIAALLGSACGISLSYGIGRFFGLYLFEKYGHYIRITPENLAKVHDWFNRYGKWTLAAGYFVPGIRHLVAYLAGTSRLRFSTFALFAYVGALMSHFGI
jgi:membrane protein DedA with SNARE-associated domain